MTYFSNDLQIDAQESLILFLVLELRKGASSDLHWYLKHLPRNFNSILRNFPEKFVPFLSDQDKGFIWTNLLQRTPWSMKVVITCTEVVIDWYEKGTASDLRQF